MNHDLIQSAAGLAVTAHRGQLRKDVPLPYVVHPIEVALILARHGFSDEVLAAALVHDVVEDTDASAEDVERLLGAGVAQLVASVTHDESLSWEERKKAYVEAVRQASPEAKAVSTADKTANAHSFISAYGAQGPALWDRFNASRAQKLWFENLMLSMLRETWNHPLVEEYGELVAQMEGLA